MAATGEGFLKRLFRRGGRRLTITGHHVGDVVETRAVHVAPGAILGGNLRAPEAVVSGLLHGTVVAGDLVVAPTGQIVGDVYARRIDVEEGGKVDGWVHSLTGDDYPHLAAGAVLEPHELLAGNGSASELSAVEATEACEADGYHPQQEALLQMLQSQLGEALQARATLEQAFDKRVGEVAAETIVRLRQLEEAYAEAQAQLEAETANSVAMEAKLAASHEELASQGQELDGVRALLRQRVESLRHVEQELSGLQERAGQLDANNLSLQKELSAALEPTEWLKRRVESLENALQAAVQRSAEQEEAQLRWQELADAAQRRAEELERQLAVSVSELETYQRMNSELSERLAWAEQARDDAARALAELRAEQTVRADPEEDGRTLQDALARSERLDAQLEAARAEIATLEEQLAWSQLSVDAVTARLQTQASERAEAQTLLRDQLEEARGQIRTLRDKETDLKARMGRLTDLLHEADRRAQQRDVELAALRSQVVHSTEATHEEEAVRQRLREALARNEELEKEVERQARDISDQRERLAETQIALTELKANLQQQMGEARAELVTLRGAATRRIQLLQERLEEKEAQLRALKPGSER